MKTDDRLRQIAEGGATEKDRRFIEAQAVRYGVKVRPNSCLNCLQDMAIEILLKKQEKALLKSERKYLLRAGKDVLWKGQRLNNLCSDDELNAALMAGFPKSFFMRINGKEV